MQSVDFLRSKYYVVENPDHPFAFDGPDILISDKRKIIAVFKIREGEVSNYYRLTSRLINTIIVYPSFTMTILIDDRGNSPKVASNFFNKVVESKDLKKIHNLILERPLVDKQNAIKKLQHRIFKLNQKYNWIISIISLGKNLNLKKLV